MMRSCNASRDKDVMLMQFRFMRVLELKLGLLANSIDLNASHE
jgi:hypothetical protein